MHGRRGKPRAESSSMRSIHILKTSETVGILTTEMRPQTELVRDDLVS